MSYTQLCVCSPKSHFEARPFRMFQYWWRDSPGCCFREKNAYPECGFFSLQNTLYISQTLQQSRLQRCLCADICLLTSFCQFSQWTGKVYWLLCLAVLTVKLTSTAGIVLSCSNGDFETSENDIECLTNTAIPNNSVHLFHYVVGDLSASCQKYDSPRRGEEGSSSDSLTRSAMLMLCFDLTKQLELSNVCKLTKLYLLAWSVKVSFSHAPALAGTSVNCISVY